MKKRMISLIYLGFVVLVLSSCSKNEVVKDKNYYGNYIVDYYRTGRIDRNFDILELKVYEDEKGVLFYEVLYEVDDLKNTENRKSILNIYIILSKEPFMAKNFNIIDSEYFPELYEEYIGLKSSTDALVFTIEEIEGMLIE